MRAIRVLAVALLGLAAAAPAWAALAVGSEAPDFSAPSALGGEDYAFSLADALKQGPVVVYFYPKAFTKGCTIEAHQFAQAMDQYKALGASVIGVSSDDIGTLHRFSLSECGSKFPVAADPDQKIINEYDAKMPLLNYATRISYVIAPDHKIIYAYSALDPSEHVANTLNAIKQWKQAQSAPTASP
ncbi:peroxiredoxin [Solimonas terrae]|uniref:thioredoxin-dependent peroxiredoxin n=1 Tax=Solimonas terrae TaxID=1396819 RepID=A0A6M2BLF0_9GAMM|nr:peroxiredoxin [Solimonas terrae]NGY03552.1 peroxiredoxin [Solimonas terrae]